MGDIEVVVSKCKPLSEAKAFKVLDAFLKKDQEKESEAQLPSDVVHQLETVRDSLHGGGGAVEEEEAASPPARREAATPPPSPISSEKKHKKKKKH